MKDLSSAVSDGKIKIKRSGSHGINIILILAILVLGVSYLFSVNSLATDGIKIKTLSVKLDELESSHKKLELESLNLKSAASIEDLAKQLNLVPASNITYLKDDNFALK